MSSNLTDQSLGRYHILEQLGEGGMATVYKAYDTRLEREVAVKVIRVDQFAPAVLERILKRFEREAKSLARLSHPNIVHINDYGEYQGVPYLVMDYLPGGTLKERLGGPLPWADAARLLLPVANALAYAHHQGIIHRDVKPNNILMAHSGDPMLTDFGIAKLLDSDDTQTLTGSGVGIGTPEYMAPEQGLGKEIDGRADIYALGVVFYEMVTGKKPFPADTPMAVVFKHISDPLPRPSSYVPELPDDVEKVLIKALSKKPENRYADMDAFAKALEGLSGHGESSLEAINPAPLAPDMQVTLDEMQANLPTQTLHPEQNIANQKPKANIPRFSQHAILSALAGLAMVTLTGVVIVLASTSAFKLSNLSLVPRSESSIRPIAMVTLATVAPPTQIIIPTHINTPTITVTASMTLSPTKTPYPTISPNIIQNPDFEDEKGWTYKRGDPNITGKYSDEWASSGLQSYKISLHGDKSCTYYFEPGVRGSIAQKVDLTGIKNIIFDLNLPKDFWGGTVGSIVQMELDIYIDKQNIFSLKNQSGVLLEQSINIEGKYQGRHNLVISMMVAGSSFCSYGDSKTDHIYMYIDNIRFVK